MKDEIILIGYIEDEKYGKLAHFFSNNKGNYFSKVIETNEILIYDELSMEEQKKILDKLANGETNEN